MILISTKKSKKKTSLNLTGGTGNNEWYTPPEYVNLARKVMGSIDTDPASNPTANAWIRAKWFYTAETNGLDKDWTGNIWLNPPYSKDLIGLFCDKLLREWQTGHITQAVILVNNATDTKWFQSLMSEAAAVCFTRGRIKFLNGESRRNSPTQGQAFVYFGDRLAEFTKEFESIGMVFVPFRSNTHLSEAEQASESLAADFMIVIPIAIWEERRMLWLKFLLIMCCETKRPL